MRNRELDSYKRYSIDNMNILTKEYIYARYSIERQTKIKARLDELSMLCSDNTEEMCKLQNKLNWISAILDIGRSVKLAINLSVNIEQIQDIIEEHKQLLKTL